MFKILRHLKNSVWTVLLIIALLVVQANCDLALPQYTSDIVDVGIQAGGIAEVAPNEMRVETLHTLTLFMTDEDAATVRSCYEENEAGNLKLVKKDRKTLDTLEGILSGPMVMAIALERVGNPLEQMVESGAVSREQADAIREVMQSGQGVLGVLRLVQSGIVTQEEATKLQSAIASGGASGGAFQQMLQEGALSQEQLAALSMAAFAGKSLPDALQEMLADGRVTKEQLIGLRDISLSALGASSEMLISQAAVAFVKSEYEAIGIDLGKLQTNYLILSGAKMLGVTAIMVVAAILVGLLASRTAAGVGRNLRSQVFSRVVSFSQKEIEQFSTASLITRSTNDIQLVQMTTVMLLRIVVYAPILGIGGILKVIGTNTGLGWIIVVAVSALLLVVALLVSVAMPKFNKMQTLVDHINLIAREILTGLPVIRAFSRADHENERFAGANRNLMKTQLFTNRVMTFMMPLMMVIMNTVSIVIIWYGAKGVEVGNLQVGDLIAFITYTMQIVMSFLMLSMVSVMLPRATVAANRVEEVLNMKPSILDPESQESFADKTFSGVVAYENVSFRYPDAEEDVLKGITFTARPGQTTAIIGRTGSGKSTVLNLIPRFFDVTSGRVTIDGVDTRDMPLKLLRSLLGYVPQKGVLFSGTIETNIKYGGSEITDADMEMAAEIAQASGFIAEKADRYQDAIAQGGANVSGGQKQRLSIARAIAKKPKVLLFDDSFSALDFKTDTALRRALNANVKDATVIIVAQRISTILHANQIIVLEEGKMAGIGTHKELMETCKLYQDIAKSQLSEEELKGGVSA